MYISTIFNDQSKEKYVFPLNNLFQVTGCLVEDSGGQSAADNYSKACGGDSGLLLNES